MKAYTEVNAGDILAEIEHSSVGQNSLLNFILELDVGMQDTGFTEALIKALVTSLKIDYTKDEMDILMESLK